MLKQLKRWWKRRQVKPDGYTFKNPNLLALHVADVTTGYSEWRARLDAARMQ